MRREEQIVVFTEEIWNWFARHKRELPWRDLRVKDDTQRAYMILVSEIMLQQTQVSRVKIVFKDFLERFTTLKDLARATNRDVLIAWRGMGYNSRALRLRDAARIVLKRFGGVFPKEMEELLSIPGIGHYTAAAIRNFAFGIPTPCLDTNIRRIYHRVFVGPENPDGTWKKDDGYLLEIAEEALEVAMASGKGTAADWHAALMDFGSLVCTKRNPKWDVCPLTARGACKAAYKVTAAKKVPKKEPGRMVGAVFVPNRIFRGRVVEALRDAPRGSTIPELGPAVAPDWTEELTPWLLGILEKLVRDDLAVVRRGRYSLKE